MRYRRRLRELMAECGMFTTTELVPLLHQRGITLSASQAHRLATGTSPAAAPGAATPRSPLTFGHCEHDTDGYGRAPVPSRAGHDQRLLAFGARRATLPGSPMSLPPRCGRESRP